MSSQVHGVAYGRSRTNNACFPFRLLKGLLLLFVPFPIAATSSPIPQQQCKQEDTSLSLVDQVIDWTRSNGGFIHEKVVNQQIGPGLSGLYSTGPIAEGELLMSIPWHLIIRPGSNLSRSVYEDEQDEDEEYEDDEYEDEEYDDEEDGDWYLSCSTVRNVRDAVTGKKKLDPSCQTPYEQYLSTRSREYHPWFWSKPGQVLLQELLEESGIEVNADYEDWNETWVEQCGEEADEGILQAIFLLRTRGEGDDMNLLVPVGDILNHRVRGAL